MEDNIWLQAGRFIQKCIKELESRGLREPFIYKLHGKTKQVNDLVAKGMGSKSLLLDLDNEERWDTKTIASAVKSCLRTLPDPLIPHGLRYQCLQEAAAYNSGGDVANLRKVLLTMPEEQYKILKMLIKHLKRVSDNVSETLMDAADLGDAFGGILMRSGSNLDGVITIALITNYSKIFQEIPRAEDATPITTSGLEPTPRASQITEDKLLIQASRFLKACIEQIETRGFDEPFLYKTEGSYYRQCWLVDCGLDPQRFVKMDLSNREKLGTRIIAGAVKECLRRLPDSLIIGQLCSLFEQAAAAYESGEGFSRISYMLTKLPEINFKILKMLIKHLKNVNDNMDLTYMRTNQLASEFGILVMRSGSRFGDVVVAALIDHYDKIFRLSPLKRVMKDRETYQDPVSATALMILESYHFPNQSVAIIERHSETIHYHSRFRLIKKCIQAIEARGLTTHLLYMEEGETKKVLNLMKLGLNPLTYDSLDLTNRSKWESNTITSAVKCCLRQMRQPLLTNKVHNWFLKPTVLYDPEELVFRLQCLVSKLPEDNYKLLEIVFKHLSRVAASYKQSHASARLAAIFCTSLINMPKFEDNIIYSIAIVTKLIANYSQIFEKEAPRTKSPSLQQQAGRYRVRAPETLSAQQ